MRFVIVATGVLLSLVVVHARQNSPSDQAAAAYQAAMQATTVQQRVALLRAAFDARPTFDASIALAEILIAERSPLEARNWSERAYSLGQPGEQRARALLRLAETYAATNLPTEYRAVLRRSIDEFPTPAAEKALLDASRPSTMSATDIVRSWRAGTEGTLRDLVITPTVDLVVNFEFDSAVIERAAEEQLQELAAAIGLVSAERQAGRPQRVMVIGHTDTVGSDEYNLRLSARRAEAVKAWLVTRYALSGADFDAEGRGLREPLVRGNTAGHHALNRRVEVRLAPD